MIFFQLNFYLYANYFILILLNIIKIQLFEKNIFNLEFSKLTIFSLFISISNP